MELDRDGDKETNNKPEKMFTLKKWNLVAMWSWDVECDTCAICRVQVMGKSSFFGITLELNLYFCSLLLGKLVQCCSGENKTVISDVSDQTAKFCSLLLGVPCYSGGNKTIITDITDSDC